MHGAEPADGHRPHRGLASGRPTLTRGALGVSGVSLLLALAGCTGAGGPDSDMPSAAEETAYAESAPAPGTPVEFFLYTHCGVESLQLGGRWWHADPPLYGPGGEGDPPAGWGDPFEKGTLTVHSAEHVTFETHGQRVDFAPAPDDEPRRMCK